MRVITRRTSDGKLDTRKDMHANISACCRFVPGYKGRTVTERRRFVVEVVFER